MPKKMVSVLIDTELIERIDKIRERLPYITKGGIFEAGAKKEVEFLEKAIDGRGATGQARKDGP